MDARPSIHLKDEINMLSELPDVRSAVSDPFLCFELVRDLIGAQIARIAEIIGMEALKPQPHHETIALLTAGQNELEDIRDSLDPRAEDFILDLLFSLRAANAIELFYANGSAQ